MSYLLANVYSMLSHTEEKIDQKIEWLTKSCESIKRVGKKAPNFSNFFSCAKIERGTSGQIVQSLEQVKHYLGAMSQELQIIEEFQLFRDLLCLHLARTLEKQDEHTRIFQSTEKNHEPLNSEI